MLFIETKAGLKQGSIENNFIWGDLTRDVPAKVANNTFRKDIKTEASIFKADGITLKTLSCVYNNKSRITKILTVSNYSKNELVGRVINVGKNWGIIQSNEGQTIYVWGNFYGHTMINMLPTYSLNDQTIK